MKFDFVYVDMALINGKVITVNEADEIAEAVGIKKNKIVYVGTTEELMTIVSPETKIVDLKGKTLMPGIVDTHVHPILNGFIGNEIDSSIINIDRSQCGSLVEMFDLIKKAVDIRKPGEWISSMGYEPTFLEEKRHPKLEELDAIAPENPVQCLHMSGHIAMYNSKALACIGINGPEDAAKYPVNEVEVIDGKLTGILKEGTNFLLWSKVNYSQEAQKKAALHSQEQFLSNGITSIHDCGECDGPSYHLMQKLCNDRIFKPRTYMMLHSIYGKAFSLEDNEHYLALGLRSGLGNNYFKMGGCKFMIDGGSGAPSSACKEPYCHDKNLKGVLGWESEEVANYICKINRADCQATAHAMGDIAVEYMVKGFEKAFEEEAKPELRHRIEHCAVTNPDLIERMAKMNICPTLNVGMITVQGERYQTIYGEKRAQYYAPLRSMMDAGIKVSIASDAPSGPLGLAMLDGAVNRKDRTHHVTFGKNQSVSVLEAIRCMTYNGAYGSYEENIKGSLEVGKLADMIILNKNILDVPEENLDEMEVDITMIDGEIVYRRQSSEIEGI
ncbi:MAG: amidohydrolase [Clostridia bacterium]|nr:amidohydrolase [Lachnospiraceae bacterium]NCC00084.1 amidohydrolase [Clostridia bacterium]NCD01928.1 amidohydrolase [Clostridia bacterium]